MTFLPLRIPLRAVVAILAIHSGGPRLAFCSRTDFVIPTIIYAINIVKDQSVWLLRLSILDVNSSTFPLDDTRVEVIADLDNLE